LLGDSLGEMALYYSLADVALLGGSFAPLGGQNLIEAAACGCSVVMGPHTFNFAEVAERAEAAGAAVRAADMPAALLEAAALLALDPGVRRQRALDFAAESGGAVRRTVDALLASRPGFT
jgi:3-deoxy-D-manno-octulosonic-acid transferase